ncbi:hypothetical protein [Streptomyces sp. NPDC002763]|uniref:hypothetical protein n=1 Tax=Streptomyces sp. NPDC002763 TaxID=3154427 RepID=UPI00332D5C61
MPDTSLRDWACSRLEWPDSPEPTSATPSVRAVVGWITRHPDTYAEDETAQLKPFSTFATSWIKRTASYGTSLRCSPAGLATDLEAVIAGLTVHWSSGGTEGAVNRVKKIVGIS